MFITVSIVEDDLQFLSYLKELLNIEHRCVVHNVANDKKNANEYFFDFATDVFLIDINLPDGSGLDVLEIGRQLRPKAKFMMLTSLDDEPHLIKALNLGATGYVLKRDADFKLIDRIENIFLSEPSFSPTITKKILNLAVGKTDAAQLQRKRELAIQRLGLGGREVQVLDLLSEGVPIAFIGDRLCISPHTVTQHLRSIYKKLNVHSRSMAVLEAKKHGIHS
ncbi:response regulator transcription factor [Rhodoferax mekongensis]|uniref:response regulator transcription factor n=1 Tax=Rhodoferax mekongensis TaxID=3068341 RepID=UPI0028BD4AEE|nr:response regulator transcription factor [Rhodoferax sp. TBRC 17199]MDT7515386.1 response regulator transcription factor [Rhodoferax sp. TBRC 17199]